jgi:predicted pyridoxine 5'-phosphate oxidase superfamily flavin-nucleotide-binding protein
MARLTSEMKEIFAKQLALMATASSDGTPNVGPKGSMNVIDDETLAYSESTGEKTFRNIKENSRVAVMVLDREKGEGYQIKGIAELLTSGDLFEKVARRQEERNRPRPKYVSKIKVEEIYSLRAGMTAKKIA